MNYLLFPLLILGVALLLQTYQPFHRDETATAALASFAVNDGSADASLKGTNVVITGITSGIGKEICSTLLGMGATVYGLSRSADKMQDYANSVQHLSGELQQVVMDMSDLDSVAAGADTVIKSINSSGDPRLSYLVNNVGINYGDLMEIMALDTKTCQGFDKSFVTNYLGHFLLSEKLLPLLQAGDARSASRIIQLASSYHWQVDGSMLLPSTNSKSSTASQSSVMDNQPFAADGRVEDYNQRLLAYGNSKMAQILHANALQSRLNSGAIKRGPRAVKVISVCPAWVGTNIIAEGIARTIMQSLAYSPEQGVTSALNGMFRSDLEGGEFIGNTDIITSVGRKDLWLTSRWASTNGVRTWLVNSMAVVLMVLQPFAFGGSYVQKSSPETYDKDIIDGLYNWSLGAVAPYLVAEGEEAGWQYERVCAA
jgi:NAD(P)-dependent dehydrogenase (short-subunit alcohol dehydrogenase family)